MAEKLNVKGADPRLESLFDFFVRGWPDDARTRDIWADRIRKAASQPGFKFDPALRRFLAYILVGSKKYSALASAKNSSYPKKNKIAKLIIRVARLIDRRASRAEFSAAHSAVFSSAVDAASREHVDDDYGAAAHAARAAARAAGTFLARPGAPYFGAHAADATNSAYGATAPAYGATAPAAAQEFAAALLYFVEQEAYGRGKRRGNPSTEKVPSLEKLLGTRKASSRTSNPSKKKTAKKATKRKAPLAKTLISKCQKAWDHYCERPSKKRIKEVFDHLEVMKESSAKTVKDERARCLRAANKEAKRLKMKR